MDVHGKHVFVFFQQSRKQEALHFNPYSFDTFDLDGDNSAKLSTCELQYGAEYCPEVDYEGEDHERIYSDLVEYKYRRNDVNKGTQVSHDNYTKLYSVSYFDLRATKPSMTGEEKQMIFHWRLNEVANAHDYIIYVAVLNEEEVIIKQIGNEFVVA